MAQTNTFQVVIASSGNESYVIYIYADGFVQWINSNGGVNDLGGVSTASVGYNSADIPYTLPGSGTCSIIHVTSRSNVGIPGMFVFSLEDSRPVFGNYALASYTSSLFLQV